MRVTTMLLARRGFLGRSMDEFQRITKSAIKQEGITGAKMPYVLLDFTSPDSIDEVKKMSDQELGGSSQVNFDHVPASGNIPAHARFHGSISTDLPANRPEVQRTGFAAWRNKDLLPTIFGRSVWNIDPYRYLALRVKSDGRRYFVNLQTESIVETDIHQHRLYAKRPGQWETIYIRWNDFVRTNYGSVVEPQGELLRSCVKSVGIGSIDRQVGPYDLSVQRIWATNEPDIAMQEEAEGRGKQEEEIERAF